MKKRIIITAALAVLMIVMASLFAFSAAAAGETVVYISDAGTGDGTSPDKPLGNGSAYTLSNGVPATGADYKASAFYLAWNKIATAGTNGTIVIVGDTTVGMPSGGNFYLPDIAKDTTITVTGSYGGVDYYETAKWIVDSTNSSLFLHQFTDATKAGCGTVVYENLNIYRTGTKGFYWVFAGHKTTLGENITVTQPNGATTYSVYPYLVGGFYIASAHLAPTRTQTADANGKMRAVDVTIKSGDYCMYTSFFMPSGYSINGNVNLDFSNCKFHMIGTSGVYAGIVANTVGSTYYYANQGQIKGDLTMSLTDVTANKVVLTTTNGTAATGTRTYAAMGNILGNVTVNINKGTTLNNQMYLTLATSSSTDATASLYGQIGGNVTVNLNADKTTSADSAITFSQINLGYGGLTSADSKYTLKVNGTNWQTSARPFTFVAYNTTTATAGYHNSVIDFSGLTYDEYWNKIYNTDRKLNNGYYTTSTITPVHMPEGQTRYAAGTQTGYGYDAVVAPANALASAVVSANPAKVAYTAGETFNPAGMAVTLTYASGHTLAVTEGFTYPNSALTAGTNAVTVSGKGAYSENFEVSVPVTVTAAPGPVVTANVIYIADEAKGLGDGSSAANAMGNGKAYADALTNKAAATSNDYKSSALYLAVEKIAAGGKDATIVICDDFTLAFGAGTTAEIINSYLPNAHGLSIKLTSKDPNGVDYRTAGAEFVLDTSYNAVRFFLANSNTSGNNGSAWTWENMNISCKGSKTMNIICKGITTVFGEGLVMTGTKAPTIIGGQMWGATNDNDNDGIASDVTVKSGTWNDYQTQNFPNSTGAASAIKGDVNINILGGTFGGTIYYGSATSAKKGGGQIWGDVNLTIANATVGNIKLTSSGNVTDMAGYADVLGDVNITVNDGASIGTIYLSPNGKNTVTETVDGVETSVTKPYGQTHGNITITYNGTGTKGLTFKDVYLGYGGFANAYDPAKPENGGKLTYKINGNNWTSTGASYSLLLWCGQGSNATLGNYYAVVDFSGMSYADYWAKTFTYGADSTVKKLNKSHNTKTGANTTASGPNGETTFGNGTQNTYGIHEIVGPTLDVYIADVAKGLGDGSSAANAMGNGTAYATAMTTGAPATSTDYQQSALYLAMKKISASGGCGRVILVDDVTIAFGGGTDITAITNFYLPNAHKQTITLTSIGPDGVNYKDAGAELILDTSKNMTRLFLSNSNVSGNNGTTWIWENLNITCKGTKTMNICSRGVTTIFGEGITTTKASGAIAPTIIGGVMWGVTADNDNDGVVVDVTVKSGTWYQYQTQNFPNKEGDDSAIKGDVNINILGGTIEKEVYFGAYGGAKKGGGRIWGDVNLTVANATIGSTIRLTGAGSSTTDVTGYGDILGDLNININDGATIGQMILTSYAKCTVDGVVKPWGQVHGNINVTYDGTGSKGINFDHIHLGYGAFATEYDAANPENGGKMTVKYKGTNWNASTAYANLVWFGSGSNAPDGVYYGVIDFSDMTALEYWTKTSYNRSKSASIPINSAYILATGTKQPVDVYPAAGPNGETFYSAGRNNSVGAHELILPTSDFFYSGTSIRLTGTEGLRFQIGLAQDSLKYVQEAGILVGNAKNFPHDDATGRALTLDDVRSEANTTGLAMKVALVDTTSGVNKYFTKDADNYYYTAVLVNTKTGNDGINVYATNNFVFREYVITKSGEVLYGNYVGLTDTDNNKIVHSDLATIKAGEGLWRSVRYVAQQAVADADYMASLSEVLRARLTTLAGGAAATNASVSSEIAAAPIVAPMVAPAPAA